MLVFHDWLEQHKYTTRVRSKSPACRSGTGRAAKSSRSYRKLTSAVIQGESEGDGLCHGTFRHSSNIIGDPGIW